MLLLYIVYALLMGAWVFTHAFRYGGRKRWALAVVAAPVLTPYYFMENPAVKNGLRLGVWGICLLAFLGGGYALHGARDKSRAPAHRFMDKAREMGGKLQDLAYDLDRRVINLDKMSRHISRKANINDTIKLVDAAEARLGRFNSEKRRFIIFLRQNGARFGKAEWAALNAMKKGYRGGADQYHKRLLSNYLDEYRNLLLYARDHHERLNNRKQPEVQNYDARYMRYRRAAKNLNRGWTNYHNFLSGMFIRYPALESLFPGGKKLATHPDWWKKGTLLAPYGK